MKKTVNLILFFLITAFFTKQVFALPVRINNSNIIQQVITPTATPTATPTSITIQKILPKITPKVLISTASPTKKQFDYTKINQHQNIIKENLRARYLYLTGIKTRLEARITIREEKGQDMTKVKEKLSEFNQYSAAYLEDINNFENKIGEILTSKTPGKIMPELRAAVKAVRTDLNAMRKILSDTVKLIIKNNKNEQ